MHCASAGRSECYAERGGARPSWAEGAAEQGWEAWTFSGPGVVRNLGHRGCREVWHAASVCWGKQGGREGRTDRRMDVLRAPQPHQDLFKARGALGSNGVEVRVRLSVWTPSL